ncbi:hypothetical protein FOZ63_019017, partial [Perkinsus olseni]
LEVCSIYISSEVSPAVMLDRINATSRAYIAGDVNSYSNLWHSTSGTGGSHLWRRGEEVEDWCIREMLTCVNENRGQPTFSNSRWSSYIDAVFAGDAVAGDCTKGARTAEEWAIPSDHTPLVWEVKARGTREPGAPNLVERPRRAANTCWERFDEVIGRYRARGPISSPEQLERRAERLQKWLRKAVVASTSSKPRKGPSTNRKDWFNDRTALLKRNYQRAR